MGIRREAAFRGGASRERARRLVLPAVLALFVWPVATSAASPTISNYTSPQINAPEGIASGPDGALWFTNDGNGSIGRVTSAGAISTYSEPNLSSGPRPIAAGPDGALWFGIECCAIGRITTAGAFTIYPGTSPFLAVADPIGITSAPDGALWFTNGEGDSIGRISTGGAIEDFELPPQSVPGGITVGPDGALWFTDQGFVGRITTGGTLSLHPLPAGLFAGSGDGITSGPDGALWFTDRSENVIGRITTSGETTKYTSPSISEPGAIADGPDGALWFTNYGNSSIGRITTSGEVTSYTDPTISRPTAITSGSDGALWFTNEGNNSIGRIGLGPRIERAEYKSWVLSGNLTDKKQGQPITLPVGAAFDGSGELNAETGAGTVKGDLSIPPFTSTFKLGGVLPLTLGLTLTQAAPLEGSVAASTTVAGDETLAAPVKLNAAVTSVGLFGLSIPTKCAGAEPVALNLDDALTREELLTKGWSFTGTTTLPRFKCEGGFVGAVAGWLLTFALSGPENPFAIRVSAPAG
jgi:virginiamycin B lyase